MNFPSCARARVLIYYLPFPRRQSELNSVGRVPPCQGGCRGFESLSSLQFLTGVKAVNGSIAQLVEQVTLNHWVVGSSPSAPTIHKHSIWLGSSVGRATD